ncbi:hypothetical protein VNI00_006628 [Paramarasmius palmivorus]|uniref:GRIP domain-containing protein n=1 Tax=Paramarasmius palmivorus TaxID=297713 RepID=A0AAW0D7Y6_9AGAR
MSSSSPTTNGTSIPISSPLLSPSEASPRTSTSSDPRASLDNTTSASTNNTHPDPETDDPITLLQHQLERTRSEKDVLAAQYNNLVAKLSTMRSTLGTKLKQDAEELDRREQLIQQLSVQNADLGDTVETLRDELITSHQETERLSNELDTLRTQALHSDSDRDRELIALQTELDRYRIKLDEYELNEMRARATKESVEALETEVLLLKGQVERLDGERKKEKERGDNLQVVLADFQAGKEHELRQAVKDYEDRLLQATQSLAEYKARALNAELSLEESQTNNSRTQELEKEVKEKNLLIGKLRHEAVIINEHLMEALRRLRRNSTDHNVDRRLVTNVLLSFLTTPRADAKRFEMLSLLATILAWSDAEREKAGLQRSAGSGPPQQGSGGSFWRRPSAVGEVQKTDETESFSRLWVEFLLTEAASGETSPKMRSDNSLPSTPTLSEFSPSMLSPTKRAPSFSAVGMASTPNLGVLGSKENGKGKERVVSESRARVD